MNLLIGFILAVLAAAAAYQLRSLDISGALAAAALGTIVFGLGGLAWAVVLLGFFISSSALSKIFKRQKTNLDEKFSKGSRRDAGQVLANGGAAGLCVLLHLIWPASAWPWAAFAASLAAANADTWATELGVLSQQSPRLITTGQKVERGTSGGISLTGTLAALSGALFIGLLSAIFWQIQGQVGFLPVLGWSGWIMLSGLAGSLLNSFLGATVQGIYICPTCQKETERHPLHTCGTPTRLVRGWGWMNNDWVNGLCTLLGAVLGGLGVLLFF